MKRILRIAACWFLMCILLSSNGLVAQEQDHVGELEQLQKSKVALMVYQAKLDEELQIAIAQGNGNVEEIKADIEDSRKKMQDMMVRSNELLRKIQMAQERGEQERERKMKSAKPERESRNRARGNAEQEKIHPELKAAMVRLNHMRMAVEHLRKAKMMDAAEMVEKQARKYGDQIDKSMDQAKRKPKGEKVKRPEARDREPRGVEKRALERREVQRYDGDRVPNDRLTAVISEVKSGFRQLRNEIRQLRAEIERIKRDGD